MASSDVSAFFESKAFRDMQAAKDAEIQRQIGTLDRLNSVIQGLNTLIKK